MYERKKNSQTVLIYNQYRVRKHNKTTQKHENVCKNENQSLRKNNKNNTEYAHVHLPKNTMCINAYQVYKENTCVKMPTLTVRSDL